MQQEAKSDQNRRGKAQNAQILVQQMDKLLFQKWRAFVKHTFNWKYRSALVAVTDLLLNTIMIVIRGVCTSGQKQFYNEIFFQQNFMAWAETVG